MPEGILGKLLKRRRRQSSSAGTQPHPVRAASPNSEPILVARNVSKAFKGVQALADASLEVRRGEILGLVGPNGSGKSTFINVVSGHYPADSGSLRFGGRELRHLAAHRISRAGLSRTYQIPRPFARLTVIENVALAGMFGHASLDRTH